MHMLCICCICDCQELVEKLNEAEEKALPELLDGLRMCDCVEVSDQDHLIPDA